MTGIMAGKVAIVTGAGGGIGREVALLLAQEGASVVVNDIGASVDGRGTNARAAQTVVEEIEAAGGSAIADLNSVTNVEGAAGIIKSALDRFGRVDAVINNAGILRDRMIFKMSPEEWQAVVDVHLLGSFLVSRAAVTHFREQESGAYVHMTSTAGLIGNFGQANYAAAKMGIVGLSKSIALDMARSGVRSNCVAPFAWSRMIGAIPTDTPEQQERVQKLKTMEAAKVAPLVVYLASDAAAEVTGQIFGVRANEIFLFSQPRPIRSVHTGTRWTPHAIAEHAMPALRPSFYPLDRTQDVFNWDPL
jgi:NAD(P)-dependent dehydrogenase (short-subunit alcohol dehydrogenase family)